MGNQLCYCMNEETGKAEGGKGGISAKWHQQHRNQEITLVLFSTRSSSGKISDFQSEFNQFTNGIQSH